MKQVGFVSAARFALGLLTAMPLIGGTALAAPVSLSCSASGEAGAVRFRLLFDEATRQASVQWESGGGRPHTPWYGEVGVDNANAAEVTSHFINIRVNYRPYADPYNYMATIDRNTGALEFARYDGGFRTSMGSCSLGETPRLF